MAEQTQDMVAQVPVPIPMPLANRGFNLFGYACLATLLTPLGLLLPRGGGIGKRARRRRIMTTTLSLLLAVLMIASPEQLYALQVQSQMAQAVAVAALATASTGSTTLYEYDDNGNLVSRAVVDPATGTPQVTQEYRYDSDNRLIQSGPQGLPSAETTVYAYDVDGLRTGKATAASVTTYLLDKNRDYAQVLREKTISGTDMMDITSYAYGDDLISQCREHYVHMQGAWVTHDPLDPNPPPPPTRYYHYDGQMSVRQLTDAPADPTTTPPVVTDRYNYDAFGNDLPIAGNTNSTENAYRYTSQQLDANTGFYYLRARYYSPAVGRFTSMDTFAGDPFAPASLHKYAYCHADPINGVDPSGMFADFSIGGLMSSIAIGSLLNVMVTGVFAAPRYLTGQMSGQRVLVELGISALVGAVGGAGGYAFGIFASEYLAGRLLVGAATGFGASFAASVANEFASFFRGDPFSFVDSAKRIGVASFSGLLMGGFGAKIETHLTGRVPVGYMIKGVPKSLSGTRLVPVLWSDIPKPRNALEAGGIVLAAVFSALLEEVVVRKLTE